MKNTNFNFYKANKAYGELYLQFPKVFLYSDKYSGLSTDAQIAYMVFKERLQYSIKNNWIDDDHNVFFIYTNKELQRLLNCSEHKVIKIKKELESNELLLQKKQGFNAKKKKNEPNRLYLADLNVEAYEVYSYQNIQNERESPSNQGTAKNAVRNNEGESPSNQGTAKNAVRNNEGESPSNQGTAKNAVRNNEGESPSNQGTAKNAVRNNEGESPSNQGTAKNTVNKYKELINKDNKDNKESYDSENISLEKNFDNELQDPETNRTLINQLIENEAIETIYGRPIVDNMKNFSNNNYNSFHLFYKKLYYAHKSIEKELGISFMLDSMFTDKAESYQKALSKSYWKIMMKYHEGKVNTINNYLFVTLKNSLREIAKDIKQSQNAKENSNPVPMNDWLRE